MFWLITAVLPAVFAFSMYFIIYAFLPAPGAKFEKALKRIRSRRAEPAAGIGLTVMDAASRTKLSMRYNAGGNFFGMLKKAVSKLVCLSDGRREAINKKLARAGYSAKAELFYADVIVRAAAVCLMVPVFMLLDIPVAAAATFFLGIGLYYKWIGEPDERIRKISEGISEELPRFVSVLSYSMTTDRDMIRTIERYLKIAKPAFKVDLELLLLEMKAGNIPEALRRFDERVGNSQLSAFISGLIDAGRGIDQKTFFYLMEENMKQLFVENKKKELSRRPARVKKAIICVGLCMFLIYLVPICVQLIDGMSMFR